MQGWAQNRMLGSSSSPGFVVLGTKGAADAAAASLLAPPPDPPCLPPPLLPFAPPPDPLLLPAGAAAAAVLSSAGLSGADTCAAAFPTGPLACVALPLAVDPGLDAAGPLLDFRSALEHDPGTKGAA
jgi:hypothetical protein